MLQLFIFLSVFFILPVLVSKILMYRLNVSWSGDSAKIDDYLYFYSVYKNKTKSEIRKIDIGLTTISGCDFTIKRENKFDRFSQKIRISNKIKIENDFLDKNIYTISDRRDISMFLNKVDVQGYLTEIFSLKTLNCSIDRIECHSGKLWASINGSPLIKDKDIAVIAKELLNSLYKLNQSLMMTLLKNQSPPKDSSFYKANVISSINIALLIYGIAINLFSRYSSKSVSLDNYQFYIWALLVSIISISIYALFSTFLLRKSSRTHMTLLGVVTFGLIGFYLTTLSVMVNINQLFDNSESIEKTMDIYEHQDHSRKGISRYYLVIGSNDDKVFRVPVSEDIFIKNLNKQKIKIIERSGFFNQHYISDFQ